MPNDLGTVARRRGLRQSRSDDAGCRGALRGHPVLEAMVRDAVVPRLAQLHRPARPDAMTGSLQHRWTEEARLLAASLPLLDLVDGRRALRALNPGGARFEAVCHDVLLPAAAHLRRCRDGEGLDQAGYLMGLWRLRMQLTGLDDDGRVADPCPRGGAAALLVAGASAAPTLEFAVTLRLFLRAGWSVQCCGRLAEEDPRDAASRRRFDLAWFCVDDATDLRRLCGTVAEVRRASCNRGMRVLSGWQVAAPPPPAAVLGADAVTEDATVAVALAQRVLAPH